MRGVIKGFLPLTAIIFGSISFRIFYPFKYLIPYLIFAMLLFTFLKIDPKKIKLTKIHLLLLTIQLALSFGLYLIFRQYSNIYAEALFICFICPAATSSTVIVRMLSGKEEFSVAYVFLSHLMVTIIAPIFFASIKHQETNVFIQSVSIAIKVFPLVVLPIILGFIARTLYPKIQASIFSNSNIPFYLWIISLVLILADTMHYIYSHSDISITTMITLISIGLVSCIVQFSIAIYIAHKIKKEPVSICQSLGQKNTTLGIYLAVQYLPHPISSISPAAYIIWQNIYNSYKLWHHNNNK